MLSDEVDLKLISVMTIKIKHVTTRPNAGAVATFRNTIADAINSQGNIFIVLSLLCKGTRNLHNEMHRDIAPLKLHFNNVSNYLLHILFLCFHMRVILQRLLESSTVLIDELLASRSLFDYSLAFKGADNELTKFRHATNG